MTDATVAGRTPQHGVDPATEAGSDGTRARILAEAMQMFTRHGYHRTTLRLLADRLGITKAAILYHFPAKDHIIAALLEPFVAALEEAVERAAAQPLPQRRWAVIEEIVDTYAEHRGLLLMARTDATIFTQESMYRRIMRLPARFVEVLVGAGAPLEDQVWALQLVSTLGDSWLVFAETPPGELRTAILRGTGRLFADGPPSGAPRAADPGAAPKAPDPGAAPDLGAAPKAPDPGAAAKARREPATGRRVGRPRALTGERIARARQLYAAGTHTADDIAAELGVSRATVYRYLT
jgi:AcrR family transcriptional regulator